MSDTLAISLRTAKWFHRGASFLPPFLGLTVLGGVLGIAVADILGVIFAVPALLCLMASAWFTFLGGAAMQTDKALRKTGQMLMWPVVVVFLPPLFYVLSVVFRGTGHEDMAQFLEAGGRLFSVSLTTIGGVFIISVNLAIRRIGPNPSLGTIGIASYAIVFTGGLLFLIGLRAGWLALLLLVLFFVPVVTAWLGLRQIHDRVMGEL